MVATDGDSVMGKGRHVIRRSEMELRRKSGVGLGIIREGRGTPGNSGVELGRSWRGVGGVEPELVVGGTGCDSVPLHLLPCPLQHPRPLAC